MHIELADNSASITDREQADGGPKLILIKDEMRITVRCRGLGMPKQFQAERCSGAEGREGMPQIMDTEGKTTT
jgi:hypothetical protein